jgi:beta-glucosidase
MSVAVMLTKVVAAWYQLGQDSAYPEPDFSSWTQYDTGNIYWGSYEAPVGLVNQRIDVMAGHPALARTPAKLTSHGEA